MGAHGNVDNSQEASPQTVTAKVSQPVAQPSLYRLVRSKIGQCFMDTDGQAYVTIDNRMMRADSQELADVVRMLSLAGSASPVSRNAVESCIETIGAECRTSGITRRVFNRLGTSEDGETMYLDLATPRGELVEITESGWKVVQTSDVLFVHPRGQLPLPLPQGGNTALKALAPLVNAEGDELVLYVAALFGTLMPSGPYPVLVISGQQGSGKSWATQTFKSIVDPTTTPLRTCPTKADDCAIAASGQHVVAFNNLSKVPPWLSDLLCSLNSGGSHAGRKLYTNYDESRLTVARPIVLNGIVDVATRSDLLDRGVLIRLQPLKGCTTEDDLRGWFRGLHPFILGGLLDAAVVALRHRHDPEYQLREKPRMADFAQWVVEGEESLGIQKGSFMRAYAENRSSASQIATEEQSELVDALERFLAPQPAWTGSISELYAKMRGQVVANTISRNVPSWFPGNVRVLSDALSRLAPDLERARGIGISRRRSNMGHIVTLTRVQGLP